MNKPQESHFVVLNQCEVLRNKWLSCKNEDLTNEDVQVECNRTLQKYIHLCGNKKYDPKKRLRCSIYATH
ncbi:hypothetical protein N9P79_02050 [Crocinitomicaceae bacterium]|nr:hypothetical protein [Crocinitomicaceae bacterium]